MKTLAKKFRSETPWEMANFSIIGITKDKVRRNEDSEGWDPSRYSTGPFRPTLLPLDHTAIHISLNLYLYCRFSFCRTVTLMSCIYLESAIVRRS